MRIVRHVPGYVTFCRVQPKGAARIFEQEAQVLKVIEDDFLPINEGTRKRIDQPLVDLLPNLRPF
jgi:hypothetical protein